MNFNGIEYIVRKFSFFSSEDPADERFAHEGFWSRAYEYPFALAEIRAMAHPDPEIHNCLAGSSDMDVVFKTWLDVRHGGAIHSGDQRSPLSRTVVWDVSTPPSEAFHDRFDAVLNIAALHGVAADHVGLLKHHLIQLKRGGRFIGTFECPGFQLDAVELFLDETVVTPPSRLGPDTSRLRGGASSAPEGVAVGYLVIERVS